MTLISALPHGFDTEVFCVPSGTEIQHDGRTLVVTDTTVVWLGNQVFCTERLFQKIKRMTAQRLS